MDRRVCSGEARARHWKRLGPRRSARWQAPSHDLASEISVGGPELLLNYYLHELALKLTPRLEKIPCTLMLAKHAARSLLRSRPAFATRSNSTWVETSPPVNPELVRIVEVGPRDGLQNESAVIPPHVKVELVNRLTHAGMDIIEAGSFVSPKWVPQVSPPMSYCFDLPLEIPEHCLRDRSFEGRLREDMSKVQPRYMCICGTHEN